MRIVCEQCQTKYIVPDEKIVKNVLRLTCQKCGHVITTRVDEASSGKQSGSETPSNTLNKWRTSTAQPAARRSQTETPVWYYSYNGESFGPFTEEELTQKLRSEKLAPVVEHCFIWRKSFSEWKPVLQVEPFASAIQAPPPPPAPAAPKPVNPNMPPLFDDDNATQQMQVPMFSLFADSPSTPARSSVKPAGASSPDVPGLKQRLQASGAATKSSVTQSKAQLEFAAPNPKKDSTDSSEDEEVGDTTRVGAPSPFFSFQSLDAISADIKAESKSGKVPEMVKPFPSLSGIAPISKNQNAVNSSQKLAAVTARSGFGNSQAPAINTLLGNPSKSGSVAKISNVKSSITPILNSQSDSAKNLQTTSAVTQKSPIPAISAAPKTTALEEMPDFKEDIGSIVAAQTPMALLQGGDENRDDSISNWLPSASDIRLDSRVEGLSLPDISLSSSSEHDGSNVNTADINIDDISMDDRDIPDIDIDDDSSQIYQKDNIHLFDSADLNSIDLDDENKSQTAEDENDEPKMLSSAQMLNMVHRSTSANKAVSREPELASADLAEIDLDDEDSLFIAANVIEDVAATGPQNSGIIGSADDLFEEQPEEQSVAKVRVSHSKLDEIASKYQDIFDMPDPEPQQNEDGISENSMMIQLAHFNKVQDKEKKKRNTLWIAVLIGVACLVVLGVTSGIIIKVSSDEEIVHKTGFGKVEGRTVSSDELNALAPIEDFEIVAVDTSAPKPKNNTRTKTPKIDSVQKETADKADTVKSDTETDESVNAENTADAANDSTAKPSANQDVMDALYGTDTATKEAEETAKPKAIPANKKDGRANIVLKSAGEFGSTEAVKGSKYGQMNAQNSAPTSRELFSIGIRNVSQTVQECHKREAKTGNMMLPKVYLRLTVEPAGHVSSFEVEEKEVPASFIKCLEGKKDRWKFAPFEGNAVKMKQGFILG